jgi:hypothetical protein
VIVVEVFRWLVFSKIVIQSNSAGRRRSDLSPYKNVEVLVRRNLILVSRQNLRVCEVACYFLLTNCYIENRPYLYTKTFLLQSLRRGMLPRTALAYKSVVSCNQVKVKNKIKYIAKKILPCLRSVSYAG